MSSIAATITAMEKCFVCSQRNKCSLFYKFYSFCPKVDKKVKKGKALSYLNEEALRELSIHYQS